MSQIIDCRQFLQFSHPDGGSEVARVRNEINVMAVTPVAPYDLSHTQSVTFMSVRFTQHRLGSVAGQREAPLAERPRHIESSSCGPARTVSARRRTLLAVQCCRKLVTPAGFRQGRTDTPKKRNNKNAPGATSGLWRKGGSGSVHQQQQGGKRWPAAPGSQHVRHSHSSRWS